MTGAPPADHVVRGMALSALGYGCFSVQDATVKWLVATYAVPQVLFTRSLVIILIALLIGGRRNIGALAHSRNKTSLALRATVMIFAWLTYYSASRQLGLAELTTIYFAAPIIVVLLSVVMLHERVPTSRWVAVVVGFSGVLLAAVPAGSSVEMIPAAMALLAAFGWALSYILVRTISRTETTTNQMLVSNTLFVLVCGATLFWTWRTPDPFSLGLMLGLGVAGGLGQYFLYEGFRYAPASVVAPIEYTSLVWAFVYGYLIWADVPRLNVFLGAALILGSSLGMLWIEHRRMRRPAASRTCSPVGDA